MSASQSARTAAAETVGPDADVENWQRLDPRSYLPSALIAAGLLVVSLVALIVAVGTKAVWVAITPGAVFVVFLVICAAEFVRYRTSGYRLTDERFELSSGVVSRKKVSIPRDRIRTVDITANIFHRVFGIADVMIGTGQSAGSDTDEIALKSVAKAEADRLRRDLLSARRPARATAGESVESAPAQSARTIVTLQWSWLRYAPLTTMSFVAIGAILGIAYKPLDAMNINPANLPFVKAAIRWAGETAWSTLLILALVALVTLVVVAGVGALAYYIVTWWGFRLEYENGIFRVYRGLLTTTSISIDASRLRGVDVVEPLLLRWGGGARTDAVATGLGPRKTGGGEAEQKTPRNYLLPPAPRALAHEVAAKVLALPASPTATTQLRKHPPAALRRRLFRAVATIVVGTLIFATLAILIPPIAFIAWPVTAAYFVLATPLSIGLAISSYRGLGHTLVDAYLVVRWGGGIRHTVALQRDGVIGWSIRQSFFQRRAGIATVGATTAAGDGVYKVYDVRLADGVRYAEEAVPDLLSQFIDRG